MKRDILVQALESEVVWDLIVIGGGASGLGVAVDAASRGYKTLLLEQADFAKGTSSRSTKLVHGGVRYLEQGNIKLVLEALHERGLFLKNAPHIARKQAFIIPVYSLWEKIKYLAGLKIYDWMAGSERIGKSKWLNKATVIERMPGVKVDRLKGGVLYYDGQFDDARMALALAQTCVDHGGVALNYFSVQSLSKDASGKVNGLVAKDQETGKEYPLKAKSVVNATGIFVDDIFEMDTKEHSKTIQPSQGIHLVLPAKFLGSLESALMIPKTDDGRVLFLVPWHEHLLMGTTDTPMEEHVLEPHALEKEIDFVLRNAGEYLKRAPQRKDVLSVFAGLRPLALPPKDSGKSTKDISRHHKVMVSPSGLITIVGGKWTTYRKMAEDTVDKVIDVTGLSRKECVTKDLRIHGYKEPSAEGEWDLYGTDRDKINELIAERPELKERLISDWPQTKAEVVWAIQEEMARKVEDVLARRMRILFLDTEATKKMVPIVEKILNEHLKKESIPKQTRKFSELISEYAAAETQDKKIIV